MNKLSLSALFAALAAAAAPAASANDFPTVDRVLYVQECLREHPGPNFEMVNKCSCALDRVAEQVRYDAYVEMTTVVKAISIGGERGSELRDNETVKPQLSRWREVQSKAKSACFIGAGPR